MDIFEEIANEGKMFPANTSRYRKPKSILSNDLCPICHHPKISCWFNGEEYTEFQAIPGSQRRDLPIPHPNLDTAALEETGT